MSTITRELAKLFRKITNSEIDAEGNAHVVLSPADSLLINNARIALEQVARMVEDYRQRIASLEARTLTVKLPPEVQFSNVPFAADGANAMRKEVIKSLTEACAAAGIKLQIEGE